MAWSYKTKQDFYMKLIEYVNGFDKEIKIFILYRDKEFPRKYNYWKTVQDGTLTKEQEEKLNNIYNTIDLYFSYFNAVSNLKVFLNDTNSFNLEQRGKIVKTINSKYNEIKTQCLSLDNLARCTANILNSKKLYIDAYNELKKEHSSTLDKDAYLKAKDLINKLLDYHNNNCFNHFKDAYNSITMKNYFKNNNISSEEIKNALETLKESFYISLINDETIKVYEDYSLNNIYKIFELVKKLYEIAFNENYELDKSNSNNNDNITKSDEEISKLYSLLNKYKKYSNYQIIHNLIFHDKYTVAELNDSINSFNNYINTNINEDKEYYIKLFKEVVTIGNDFENGIRGIFDLIISNSIKDEKNKNISFDLLYFNGLNPHSIRQRMLDTMLFFKVNEQAKQYCKEYSEYYNKRKELEKLIEAKNKIEEEKKKVPEYEKILLDYINGDYKNIKEFCDSKKLSETEFKHIVEMLKKFESPIYTNYENYTELKQAQRFASLHGKLNKMLNEIVEMNGKFNLLNYYEYTNLTFTEVFNILKNTMTPDQRRAWNQFASKYKKDSQLDFKRVLDEQKLMFAVEMDNKGNVLRRYEVTKEDKQQALLMLKEKNIPITNATFSLMIKKYFDEEILPSLIDNNKTKSI